MGIGVGVGVGVVVEVAVGVGIGVAVGVEIVVAAVGVGVGVGVEAGWEQAMATGRTKAMAIPMSNNALDNNFNATVASDFCLICL